MSHLISDAIDEDTESLPNLKYYPYCQQLIKCKISITVRKRSKFLDPRDSQILSDPSPCQYAIIEDKPFSLKGLLPYTINAEDDPIMPGKGLDLEYIFSPYDTSTNVRIPLLHLAILLGRYRCLKVLLDFLKSKGVLQDWINRPDLKTGKLPIECAFKSIYKSESLAYEVYDEEEEEEEFSFFPENDTNRNDETIPFNIIPLLIRYGANIQQVNIRKEDVCDSCEAPPIAMPIAKCAVKYPRLCFYVLQMLQDPTQEVFTQEEFFELQQYLSDLKFTKEGKVDNQKGDNNIVEAVKPKYLKDYLISNIIIVENVKSKVTGDINEKDDEDIPENIHDNSLQKCHQCGIILHENDYLCDECASKYEFI
ncbi:hypothetical protein TRFO_28414 [Tritrichomonas foetus]|uniref:Uncharacterized protein n=1 Tax=Tritrichomonas foetus TaxID=1144522 RepID=A0A1J4JYE6_9EUKA|nr:hypothetical protein TRFO_28414 [Tritrichomonas foetus]|eukprot:OHT04183.1 hypothetical protein TRFO_28414 [Tritrichomonas foetus]